MSNLWTLTWGWKRVPVLKIQYFKEAFSTSTASLHSNKTAPVYWSDRVTINIRNRSPISDHFVPASSRINRLQRALKRPLSPLSQGMAVALASMLKQMRRPAAPLKLSTRRFSKSLSMKTIRVWPIKSRTISLIALLYRVICRRLSRTRWGS